MPSLNFKSQFVGLVQTGKKTQTIRAPRKYPIKVGDRLILSVGARTKHYRQIGEAVATEVVPVCIECECTHPSIRIGAHWLTDEEVAEFAKLDGFNTAMELAAWFENVHGLPFAGDLIRWKLATAP